MLTEHSPGSLWTADMPAGKLGFNFGARMTIVRLPGGGLWLHSPIALTPELRAALEALGPVEWLVAPSKLHYEHVRECAAAYPAARLAAVPGAARKLGGVRVAVELGDELPPEWAGALEQSAFRGSRLYDEVDFFHPASWTLILTDLCFNLPPERGAITRLIGGALGIVGRPGPSRTFGLTLRDRAAARASVERLLAWDFDRIILSHGDIVETGGREALRRAFARLLR